MKTTQKLRKGGWVAMLALSATALTACDVMLEPPEGGPPKPPGLPTPTSTQPTPLPTAAPSPPPNETPGGEVTPTPAPISTQTPEPTPTDASTPEPSPSGTVEPTPTPTETTEPTPTPTATPDPTFEYQPPGDLIEGSGTGSTDDTVYVPDMVFPIKSAPAYPQSQVYRFGGGVGGGDQCDARNFSAPWQDNYCEARSRSTTTPYCPSSGVHVGQDIRVGTPEGCQSERSTSAADRKRYAVVAAEDGYISNIGSYTVNVRAGGRIYRYMHMNMKALEVELGQDVSAGDTLGYVSNDFGGTPTTLHLHFEIKHNTAEHGWTFAPPYTSLVKAYERREGGPGKLVQPEE